jgi:hypothetical protein
MATTSENVFLSDVNPLEEGLSTALYRALTPLDCPTETVVRAKRFHEALSKGQKQDISNSLAHDGV